MRKFLTFLFAIAFGGALVACAYEYHIIRTADSVVFVRKQSPDWRQAYVDVRGWKPRDWAGHPRLVRNLTLAKREDVIEASALAPVPPSWFKNISNSNEEDLEEDQAESGGARLDLEESEETSHKTTPDASRR